jgi:hypothetical protein
MNDRTTPSDPWGHGFDVNRLADRLDELADYVTQGADCVRRNFVMQVPAEPYHDADLVISTAARLLRDGLVTPPSPAQPPAQPVNLAELHDPDFSGGLTPSQHLDVLRGGPDPRAAATASAGPLEPDVDHILRLAEIIRDVDGKHDLGAAALAEAILAHPGFSGCHDGPAALPAQGEVGSTWQPIETAPRDGTWVLLAGGECEFNEESDNKGRAVTARWTTEFSCRDTSGRWQFAYYDSGVYGEYENPTHWQPRPPNPHA